MANTGKTRLILSAFCAVLALCLMAAPGAAAEHTIEARSNNTFFPANLTIEVGDTVTFVNVGGFHNVAANDGSFRCANGCDGNGGSGAPGTGWSFNLTFNDPGTIGYHCQPHQALGMTGTITVQTAANDEPGNLRFATASASRLESAGSFSVSVDRVGGDDGAVSVSYSTSNGSALAGSDYTSTSGVLNWASGDDGTRSFQVPILDDAQTENDETINVALSNPTGGAGLATPSNSTLTIGDDDDSAPAPGELGFVSSQFNAGEAQGTHTVTVQRTGGTDGAVGVDYATSDGSALDGSDYTVVSGTLQWNDGEGGTKNFDVTLLDDDQAENSESVNLALSNPSGGATLGTSSATLEIADDDASDGCIEDATTLCLTASNRFLVRVDWRTVQDDTGPGRVIPFAPVDTGLFWFFDANNAEILVKVLNGCAITNHYWVFAAASTDVEYTMTVTDTANGLSQTYVNVLGERAPAVTDTAAFATCP